MSKRPLIAIALAAGLLGATAAIIAQPIGPGPGQGPGQGPGPGTGMGLESPAGPFGGRMGSAMFRFARMFDRIGDELGLSDVQRDEIRAILDAGRAELEPLAGALHDNHLAIAESSQPETYDPLAVSELAAAQGDLVAELIVLKSRIKVDVLNVLTPQQRDQLEELRQRPLPGRFGGG